MRAQQDVNPQGAAAPARMQQHGSLQHASSRPSANWWGLSFAASMKLCDACLELDFVVTFSGGVEGHMQKTMIIYGLWPSALPTSVFGAATRGKRVDYPATGSHTSEAHSTVGFLLVQNCRIELHPKLSLTYGPKAKRLAARTTHTTH